MLLNRLGQQLDQGQAARHPTRTAVETARQLIERVVEALFHLRQQPALFKRAFLRTQAHGSRQEQRVGFAHIPDCGLDRVAAQLLERDDTLMAVDDQIRAVVFDDDDGCLLPVLSQ